MPFTGYRITSPFGYRALNGKQEFHTGIDLAKSHKAPIHAFTDGTVLFAGMGQTGTGFGGYGNVVLIKDKNNRGQLYAHLDSVAVKKGQVIKKGQVVGAQGNTGKSIGSHLHYEVRKSAQGSVPYGWIADRVNNCLNPTTYLKEFNTVANTVTDTYTIKKGDTLTAVAKKYETTVDALVKLNGIKNKDVISIGQKIKLPGATVSNGVYHTVKKGDSVTSLARRHGSTIAQIKSWNKLKDVNVIVLGQKLRVK